MTDQATAKPKVKRITARAKQLPQQAWNTLQSATEQTLDRLCTVASHIIDVPCAALVLHQNGISRVIASSGLAERYRSYRWTYDDVSYGPADLALVLDASNKPAKQKAAHDLGLTHAGFYMRLPVVLQEDCILSLLLMNEKAGKKPSSQQMKLLDEAIVLMSEQFRKQLHFLADPTSDITVALTLADLAHRIDQSSDAEALLDSRLKAVAVSPAIAALLDTTVDKLHGRNYADISFSGAEPIGFFCQTALQTHISPPDFEVTTEIPEHPKRVFQLSVSPLSPTDTREYFLHFRVREITTLSEHEKQLFMLAAHAPHAHLKVEPSFAFLQETLVERRSLRARKDLTYLTLRAWRQPIREYQIKALKSLKQNLPHTMPGMIADEMAAELNSLVGASAFKAIVPIPCGHTREGPCLSLEIARALSVRLNLPVVQAFAARPMKGTSHPKEIKKRPPLALVRPVYEPVLLVDDVATSGAHLEEASALLKKHCGSLLAFAWIGGDAT